jgi:hypothetical protein
MNLDATLRLKALEEMEKRLDRAIDLVKRKGDSNSLGILEAIKLGPGYHPGKRWSNVATLYQRDKDLDLFITGGVTDE